MPAPNDTDSQMALASLPGVVSPQPIIPQAQIRSW